MKTSKIKHSRISIFIDIGTSIYSFVSNEASVLQHIAPIYFLYLFCSWRPVRVESRSFGGGE
jgi:hypothetical protein